MNDTEHKEKQSKRCSSAGYILQLWLTATPTDTNFSAMGNLFSNQLSQWASLDLDALFTSRFEVRTTAPPENRFSLTMHFLSQRLNGFKKRETWNEDPTQVDN